ncbi:phosphoglycerate mutase-like protein [Coemansia reversa NRRL 1564]|uniref:Phosphoglycerate mutase-like protein n=1 Tax=Coemansia reversa (strain ATCC 12441 / NRRL 1564) TaxID=763665 RepID=A0A2G5BJE8_COERN|nr:phosphoglycerate mutase-like protein [Coemansia reversa NRRL 1564]|eukprot:PIA19164.1 phosphoglycerate mutase-like protein [Coemansia reversa NRRL 1564]
MQLITISVVTVVAAATAATAAKLETPPNSAASSAFDTDVANYKYDDSSYSYCNPGYPSVQSYSKVPGAELELLQLVVRHGDRTPVNLIANETTSWTCDGIEENIYLHAAGESKKNTTGSFKQIIEIPEWNGKFGFSNHLWRGSCESGELTDRGKHQHNLLGSQLRSIYVDKLGFLPKELNSTDEVYARTTMVWRTKNSAESLFGGLWPKRSISPVGAIPLHSYPSQIETMYGNPGVCPKLSSLLSQIVDSAGYQKFLRDQGPLMTRLSGIFGVHGSGWDNGWDKYVDVLNTRQCHNMDLPCSSSVAPGTAQVSGPQCATADDVAQVTHNANYEWAYKYRDHPLSKNYTRLNIGSFVGTLREQMQGYIAGKTGKLKFALYSGHDSTIWPLLSMLGADNKSNLWPPYASNLAFELWKKQDGSRVVRVIFNGQILALKDNWCDMNACPLEKFFGYIDDFIPSDIASECKAA